MNVSRASSSAADQWGSSPVVLGRGRNPTGPRYCFIPGAGASTAGFSDLVALIDGAVVGVEPRGLDGRRLAHSTVPAAAEYYVRGLRETLGAGPVRLLGHSFGGWVALEMTRLLSNGHGAVQSLTLLDSEAPVPLHQATEYTHFDATLIWIAQMELLLERSLGVTREDLASRTLAGQRELLHGRLVEAGILPKRSQPNILTGLLHSFATALRAHFEPTEPFHGPVQLILVDDLRLDARANAEKHEQQMAGWRRWAPNLTTSHVPGNHLTILRPPHVDALAKLLPHNVKPS